MANLWKHTMTFSWPGYGSSENWYFLNSSADPLAMLNLVRPVAQKRAPLLGKDGYLITSRVQMIEMSYPGGTKTKRIGLIETLNLRGQQTISGADNFCCDNGISLKVLCKDYTKQRSKFVMLPATWAAVVPTLNSYNPTGTFPSLFNQWSAQLIALGYGWLGNPGDGQVVNILGYDFDEQTGKTTFTLQNPGMTWPNNALPVRVNVRFPKRNWLDGVYLVTHTTATTCRTVDPAPAPPFSEVGQMSLIPSSLYVLADPSAPLVNQGLVIPQASMRRKRGRPLYASRGRAPEKIQSWQG